MIKTVATIQEIMIVTIETLTKIPANIPTTTWSTTADKTTRVGKTTATLNKWPRYQPTNRSASEPIMVLTVRVKQLPIISIIINSTNALNIDPTKQISTIQIWLVTRVQIIIQHRKQLN